jgi:hypothetical protein
MVHTNFKQRLFLAVLQMVHTNCRSVYISLNGAHQLAVPFRIEQEKIEVTHTHTYIDRQNIVVILSRFS